MHIYLRVTVKARIRRVALVLIVCLLAAAVAGFFFQRLGEIDDFTAVSRLAIWGGAFTVFARSPVLGTGFGNLRALMGGLLESARRLDRRCA